MESRFALIIIMRPMILFALLRSVASPSKDLVLCRMLGIGTTPTA